MSTKYILIFGFQKNIYYIYNMEKILAFILSSTIWYLIFSFITWNTNAFEWHWGVRLVYSLFVINILRNALNKD